MPSVTEIIEWIQEPELVAWKLAKGKAYCEKVQAEALRVGTAVDSLVKADLRGLPIDAIPPSEIEILACWQAWQDFKRDHLGFPRQITGIQTELTVADLIGHPDLEVSQEASWGIVDIKTSKAISPKAWTQVCQYASMKQESQQLDPPAFVGILRLDKQTGRYQYMELTDPKHIAYEHAIFEAYYLVYQHGENVRERTRQALEQEVLG